MTKKQPYRKGQKRKAKKVDPAISDPRVMEKFMADISRIMNEQEFESVEEANAFMQAFVNSSGELAAPAGPRTPLEQAQDLIYNAWETGNRKQRTKLARQALKISEDCADAYVLLAEEIAGSPEEALELYQAGVRAGERALGPAAFEQDEGHFWGKLETRPYMRARAGLASTLWQLERRQEAIAHYQEMLRLNPGDNQGIRYLLLICLLEEGADVDSEQLLQAYAHDIAADWLYARALLGFRAEGASRSTRKLLMEALKCNPYVPAYLLGRRRLPRRLPSHVGFGDESEAVSYVAAAGHLWLQDDGAMEWLRQVSDAM